MIGLEIPMPASCSECTLMDDGWCYASGGQDVCDSIDAVVRPDWCPIIDLTDDGK